jgi:RNA polymerase sigma factor (sigma-70 family)
VSRLPAHDLQRLLANEPYVRSLAHALFAADADDVAQQTWLFALQHGGADVGRPRHWLARIVRNAAANLRRGDRRRRERERDAAAEEAVPSSAELMQREERRRALVQAVDELPPALRAVVLLRWFDGLPPRRIAARLGLPVTTVWSQLQRALQHLRRRLDAEQGDRRAWLLPLLDLGRPDAAPMPAGTLPTGPLVPIGVIAMTMKTKLVAAAAVAVVAAGALLLWHGEPVPGTGTSPTANAPSVLPAHADMPAAAAANEQPTADAAHRETVAAAAPATTGALRVHVRWGDDHAPAAGVTMRLCRIGGEPRFDSIRRATDDKGEVLFDAQAPGPVYVISDRSGLQRPLVRTQIEAGKIVDFEHELEVGLVLTGIVVEHVGVPVAGALVECEMPGRADADLERLATTGADGRFRVRGAPTFCAVGARAAGYVASTVKIVNGKEGNTADVRLELGGNGGVVDGLVVDPDGAPVANAVAFVGGGRTTGAVVGLQGGPPAAALARTDAEGRFRAVGIPAGDQPVQVRAAGLAPFHGACVVPAGGSTSLRVTLTPGAIVRGVVRNAADVPVRGAEVEVGDWDELAHFVARSAADGSFELRGLPAGELEVKAKSDKDGRARQRVHTEAGQRATCDLLLSRGLELRGHVLNEHGEPVAKAMVECIANQSPGGDTWFTFEHTDAEGRFTAANCPEEGSISVRVQAQGIDELRLRDVDPKQSPLELRVQTAAQRTARIVGRVLTPDGKPLANVSVHAFRRDRADQTGIHATDQDGRFALGPLAPGTWDLEVRAADHPRHSEKHELATSETWDLGEIRLTVGGTAAVTLVGKAEELRLLITDAGERLADHPLPSGDAMRTGPLEPGNYRLFVSARDVTAQVVPFAIRAGETTAVEVRLQPGIRQRFEFVGPAGGANALAVRVLRGGELLMPVWPGRREDGVSTAEIWLAAGSYSVQASAGPLAGRAEFTVGSAESAPVRVELR